MSVPYGASCFESDRIRKRVSKACDRCRLKKSKCDGSNPCLRCKADNTICMFGERRKPHNKVYPKGYVEMLEQQQAQLVAGLQEMYHWLCAATAWPSAPLIEHGGHPLTHEIIVRLDLLYAKQLGNDVTRVFEEDCQNPRVQSIAHGAPYIHRRSSFSSDYGYNHIQEYVTQPPYSSAQGSPLSSKAQAVFTKDWCFQPASPESSSQSPAPNPDLSRCSVVPSPPGAEAFEQRDYLSSQWSELSSAAAVDVLTRSQFTMQAPELQDDYQPLMHGYVHAMDSTGFDSGNVAYSPQLPILGQTPGTYNLQDWTNEPMDMEFSRFVQASI